MHREQERRASHRGAARRWTAGMVRGLGGPGLVVGVLAAAFVAASPAAGAEPAGVVEAVHKASAAYVEAYNSRDFAALAEQWTERAELVEGASRVEGRAAIVGSIRGWLERHPQARLAIEIGSVDVLAEPLARVRGVMRFTEREGAVPVVSRFESLRVLHAGTWRLTESVVAPSHAAALADLGWLVGTWRSDAGDAGTAELTVERGLGGYCLIGRGSVRPKDGTATDSLMLIHADRGSGAVRSWVFDSTGARGEGVVQSDGTTLHVTFVGVPSEDAAAAATAWVQVITPQGADGLTLHAIERSIDGVPVADGAPLHYKRVP
ncbi:MAG TPA: hypothetical protein DC048_12995 [Planctomycetaceae bacterium]|nr:hypothetical protein [Planctomycetaceae bacterium]